MLLDVVLADFNGLDVVADQVRLTQVLFNLLNNAAKYTDQGGKIWLKVERQGSELIIAVRDTGIGIPQDKLNEVFEMFSQLQRSLEQTRQGLGVGLTLVKHLVEMHSGSIEVRSAGPGRGPNLSCDCRSWWSTCSRQKQLPATARTTLRHTCVYLLRTITYTPTRASATSCR